jgi:amino acid transporter
LNRSRVTAAVMVVLLAASLVLLFLMPAESDDTADLAVTYASLALFVVALALVAPVIYFSRRGGTRRPAAAEEEVYGDEASDIEKEFEALEKEIDREEKG